MLGTPIQAWVVFAVVIVAALVLDLGVFHRESQKVSLRTALIESAAWIGLSLLFAVYVHFARGPQAGVSVPHGIPGGKIAQRRQHIRVRADLSGIPGSRAIAA